MDAATHDPRYVPSRTPGVILATMRHSTAPRRLCARKLDTDVNMMLAMDVPRARCMIASGAAPCRARQNASMGTMTSPPPMPSNPARTPAAAPTAQYIRRIEIMAPLRSPRPGRPARREGFRCETYGQTPPFAAHSVVKESASAC